MPTTSLQLLKTGFTGLLFIALMLPARSQEVASFCEGNKECQKRLIAFVCTNHNTPTTDAEIIQVYALNDKNLLFRQPQPRQSRLLVPQHCAITSP